MDETDHTNKQTIEKKMIITNTPKWISLQFFIIKNLKSKKSYSNFFCLLFLFSLSSLWFYTIVYSFIQPMSYIPLYNPHYILNMHKNEYIHHHRLFVKDIWVFYCSVCFDILCGINLEIFRPKIMTFNKNIKYYMKYCDMHYVCLFLHISNIYIFVHCRWDVIIVLSHF